MKWFDLKDLGAKVERSQEDSGAYFLRLTFETAPDDDAIKSSGMEGWVGVEGAEGKEFRNYRDFSRTSSIVSALQSFFERDEIVASKKDVGQLRQNEELLGYLNTVSQDIERNRYPDADAVSQNLVNMLDQDKRERIIARVNAAQAALGTISTIEMFDGRGIDVWKTLAKHFGYHDATAAMIATTSFALENGELFRSFHDALMSASETGRGLEELLDGERYPTGHAVSVADRLRDRFEMFGKDDPAYDEEFFYRAFYRAAKAKFAVWDGKYFERQGADDINSYGARFLAEPGIPASWRDQLFRRISLALEATGDMLGTAPNKLFNDTQVFHIGRATGREDVLGYARNFNLSFQSGGADPVSSRLIKFKPTTVGVLIHEIAHAVHLGHAALLHENEDDIAALIGDTGIQEVVTETVRRAGVDDRFANYLTSPNEVVARTFELAVANHLEQSGDPEFRNAGGAVGLVGGFDFTPPKAMLDKFVSAMKEVMEQARHNRFQAEHEQENSSAISHGL